MRVDPSVSLAAADRLFKTVEHGNLEDMREIFAPDAWIWHNTDNRAIDVEASIRSIRWIKERSLEYRYTEIRREPTPSGFVQQHLLIIRLKNGPLIHDPACCVCSVKDGRIGNMDAYHDSAVFNVPGFGRD